MSGPEAGIVAALYRHPIKGFTPERLATVDLAIGRGLAWDRAYAVEDGDSSFDPAAPKHIGKMRFTVLAKIPKLARAHTRYHDETGDLSVETEAGAFTANLLTEPGRAAFSDWLADFLGEEASGPLRVLPAPGAHRFYDHPQGDVSLINLASLRDFAERTGRAIDPLRFRANLLIDGWPPWLEIDALDARVKLGGAEAQIFSPIRRCLATHVNPDRGVRDLDTLGELQRCYGHVFCGAYLRVVEPGRLAEGDRAELVL